ncbi:hypothetical protein JCM10212_004968 [Sporobolomyces blumeae]
MPAPRKSLFSSLASTSDHPDLPLALLEWVKSQPSVQRVVANDRDDDASSQADRDRLSLETLEDLMDGIVLSQVLIDIDQTHFNPLVSARFNAKALDENWVLRFNHLKRLYKLVIRYFEDTLSSSTTELSTPNLQLVAKGNNGSSRSSGNAADEGDAKDEVCKLAGLVLALTVQSEQRLEHIERIQGLEEWVQRELMYSIEQVMSKVQPSANVRDKDEQLDADSEFYHAQHEKSRLIHDRETVQGLYEELREDFERLKETHDETLARAAAAETRAAESEKKLAQVKADRNEAGMKGEIERLRAELSKTENQLGETEQVVERQTKLVEGLTRKVDDLTPLAAEATRLKDQMDEYRHAADKSKKMENVLDKYKKKVEEAGEWKRMIKTLEDENSELLDKTTALTEQLSQSTSYKPLVDSYKEQVSTLETKLSAALKDREVAREEARARKEEVERLRDERDREKEGREISEERVRELELTGRGKGVKRGTATGNGDAGEADADESIVGSELDDAFSGRTTTSLKLRIRQLERQIANGGGGEGEGQNRLMVVESLLEDAEKMKKRYEGEYLKECRDRLRIERKLEEILNAKGKGGNGPEVAIALRQRLNETVDEAERTRKELTKVRVELEGRGRELTIAKSDLSLVNKDQLEVLHSLRASVSLEKDALAADLDRTKSALTRAEAELKGKQEQMERLLLDKIDLQGDGISQREKMLEREREFGSSQSASQAEKAKMAELQTENATLQGQIDEMQEKLQKAKAFIKSQDKLFREAHVAEQHGNFEEAEQSYQQQIQQLREELERQKLNSTELENNYRREHDLILSAWHDMSMRHLREKVVSSSSAVGSTGAGGEREYQPQSWIKQQRLRANGKGLRSL